MSAEEGHPRELRIDGAAPVGAVVDDEGDAAEGGAIAPETGAVAVEPKTVELETEPVTGEPSDLETLAGPPDGPPDTIDTALGEIAPEDDVALQTALATKVPETGEIAGDEPSAPAPPAPRGSASGWHSVEPDGTVRGWCRDRAQGNLRLDVAILIDGVVAGTARADRPHLKLAERGEGDGRFAFALAIPAEYRDGAPHEVAVEIVTPGYGGIALKTKEPIFKIDPAAAAPGVIVRRIGDGAVEGVLVGEVGLRQEIDVWHGDTRLDEGELAIEWGWGERASFPFRLMLAPGDDRGMFALSVGYPGMHEAEAGIAIAALVRPELSVLGDGRYEVQLRGDARLDDGTRLRALVLADDDRIVARRELVMEDGGGTILLDAAGDPETLRLRVTDRAGTMLGDTLALHTAGLPRRLVRNGVFRRWTPEGPEHFEIGENVVAERGFYAFPPALKRQYHLSGNSVALAIAPGAASAVVLRQALRRSGGLGHPPVAIGAGLFLRASRPMLVTVRLVDAAGAETSLGAMLVGTRWTAEWRAAMLDRDGTGGADLAIEVLAQCGGDEAGFLEIAGMHGGDPTVTHFSDMLDGVAATPVAPQDGNRVVNAALLRWPLGLAVEAHAARMEIADGWTLAHAGGPIAMRAFAVAPADRMDGRYAMAVRAPNVTEACRLEIALDCAEIVGRGTLSLTAMCDTPDAPGRPSAAARWSQIDRVSLLRRQSWRAGDEIAVSETVIGVVARRVVLTRRWEESRFEFTCAPAGDPDFDLAREGGGLVEHLLVCEFRRPIAVRIEGVDLRLEPPADTPHDPPLELEDRNIRAQIEVLRGVEAWASPAAMRPPANPALAPVEASHATRWSRQFESIGSVDVAICVHNAPDETLACLSSLVGTSSVPHLVRIVDDGSDADCRSRIEAFIADKPWMTLAVNESNLGYTRSANRAVRGSDADWVILLNSDTIVTPGWIEGLLEVAALDRQVAMVGPVSNAATYQSVPDLYDSAGKWAVNDLPEGYSPATFAAFVAQHARKSFPEAPLLNGFCTLIRRRAFDEVGGFDEASFPSGYGEENDLGLRLRKAGYRLRIADHVYVWHAKSASFGAARAPLAKAGDKALRVLHPDIDFAALGRGYLETPALVELRSIVRRAYGAVVSTEGQG